MGTAELGVVIVMMVVGASPDAAGAEREDAEDSHQTLGQAGVGQDRLVLLIMINHKKPQNQQSGEKTANDPDGQREVQERARKGCRQKKRRGENTPPTPDGGIHRVGLGCQYKIFSGSQDNVHFFQCSALSRSLPGIFRQQGQRSAAGGDNWPDAAGSAAIRTLIMEPAARIWGDTGRQAEVWIWGEHPMCGRRGFRLSKNALQAVPDIKKSHNNKTFLPRLLQPGRSAGRSMGARREDGYKNLKRAAEFFNRVTSNNQHRTSNFERLIS